MAESLNSTDDTSGNATHIQTIGYISDGAMSKLTVEIDQDNNIRYRDAGHYIDDRERYELIAAREGVPIVPDIKTRDGISVDDVVQSAVFHDCGLPVVLQAANTDAGRVYTIDGEDVSREMYESVIGEAGVDPVSRSLEEYVC